MSQYYKYDFISPEGIFSKVKEELKSYFDTGSIDDLLFNLYTNECLDKLGKGSYKIIEEILHIEDYQSRLPDNFYAVREAWLCTAIQGFPYQSPNSFYSQAASSTTIQVSPVVVAGRSCTNVECTTGCPECMPELIQAVYKTNNELAISYKREYLLKPGNISTRNHCTDNCPNLGASGPDSFDIKDNKFTVNFRCGKVHLICYVTDYDNSGNQLIPDNYRIKQFIEKFLKFKVFETLCNQVNDETFNQLMQKKQMAQQEADEAYIMADLEIKKQDVYTKQKRIKQDLNRNNKYELPNGSFRGGIWRRRYY